MRVRNNIFGVSTVMLALMLMVACEPQVLTSQEGEGEIPSCCEEPTPSLADARKQAMMKDGEGKAKTDATGADEPTAPSLLSTKQPADVAKTKTEATGDTKELPALPAPAEREKLDLDFTFTDQDEQSFDLKTIKGKVAVVTFIFTSCPNPNMCPLQGAKMAAMQSRLEKAGLSDEVNLLVFTFDPNTDTPAVLKKWGQTQGIKYTNAKMLRPEPRDFIDFQYAFGFRAGPTADGKINHQTDLMLIDREGRLAAFYGGLEAWNDAQVLAKVKELIAE